MLVGYCFWAPSHTHRVSWAEGVLRLVLQIVRQVGSCQGTIGFVRPVGSFAQDSLPKGSLRFAGCRGTGAVS
jgi:hypothetical protein